MGIINERIANLFISVEVPFLLQVLVSLCPVSFAIAFTPDYRANLVIITE